MQVLSHLPSPMPSKPRLPAAGPLFCGEAPAGDRLEKLYLPPLSVHEHHGIRLGYKADVSTELPRYTGPRARKDGIYIDFPAYAIADRSKPLQTSGMYSCATLVLVGPKKHCMAHITPHWAETLGRQLPEFEAQVGDLRQCRIFLLPGVTGPGRNRTTQQTVHQILHALHETDPALPKQVEFVHYPPAATQRSYEHTVAETASIISHDGQVAFQPCDSDFRHKFLPDGINVVPWARPPEETTHPEPHATR